MTNFTELPMPPKTRLIIRMHTTSELDPIVCEMCEKTRFSFADERPCAPMCDVCGLLLCWKCFGSDFTYPGPDLKQYNCCNECFKMEEEEVDAILNLRAQFSRGGIA